MIKWPFVWLLVKKFCSSSNKGRQTKRKKDKNEVRLISGLILITFKVMLLFKKNISKSK